MKSPPFSGDAPHFYHAFVMHTPGRGVNHAKGAPWNSLILKVVPVVGLEPTRGMPTRF